MTKVTPDNPARRSLSVSADVEVCRPNKGATRTLAIGAGTATIGGNLSLPSNGEGNQENRIATVTISTGTLSVGGNITMGAFQLNLQTSIVFSGAGTLNIGGNFTTSGGYGTLTTVAGSTVNYNGSSAQSVLIDDATNAITYNNLTFSNSGTKTLSGAISATNVTGNIAVNGGTLNNGGYAIVGNAGKTVSVANGATFLLAGTSGMPTGFPAPTLGTSSTVDYAGGNQTVSNLAYGNLTLSGSGTKTMPGTSMSINGNFTVSGSTTVTAGNSLTIGGNVVLGGGTFNASSYTHNVTGNWTNNGGTFNAGTSTINLNGTSAQVIGGTGTNTFNNLTIANSAGVSYAGSVTVSGNLSVTSGYVEMDDQYFQVPNNTIQIAGFAAVTSTATSHMPQKVNRDWTISGTWSTGNVTCRFYWDDADDGNFNWGSYTPSVYKGTDEFTQTAYDVSGSKNWVEVSIPADKDLSKGTYTIGRSDEGTLPVELSSFTVAMNGYSMVTLQWVTQSETNVSGFRIYRNTVENMDTAQMLSVFVPATNTSQMQVYQVTDEEVYQDGVYYYWLENVDLDGVSQFHGPVSITVTLTNPAPPMIPVIQGISNAYPNPFNPRVTLSCGVLKSGQTQIDVYNLKGQLVKTLFTGMKEKGNFTIQWDGTDNAGRAQSSGIYFVRMKTDTGAFSHKVVLSK